MDTQALEAHASFCSRPPKRCSPECSSCSSTANAWQPSKTHKTDHLMSPQQATVPAYQDEQQKQQSAPLTGLVLAHCRAPPQQSARTQQLLRLLILLRARRQLRSNNAAGQQQQQQLVSAVPALYCPPPTPEFQLAAALSGTRACIDAGLHHLRSAATLLTSGCDSSAAEAALAAAEAALADSIQSLTVAKAAATQQLVAQMRAQAAAAAAAAAQADDDLQDTCCSSMTCHTAYP